jgi:DNA repair exonuclease SbcCD ATPase subunit
MRSVMESLLLAAVALCWTVQATAQTTAAETGKLSSLGKKGTPSGKPMSREELRACLNQQAELARRRPDLTEQQAALKRGREELLQIEQTLKTERASFEQTSKAVAEINERTKALAAKIEDYNTRHAAFQQAGRTGQSAERQRREFESEQKALQAESEKLQAERGAVTPVSEQTLKTYNARAASQDQAASEWNANQAELTKVAQKYETERETWTLDCADRPYREDDEIAIKAGK